MSLIKHMTNTCYADKPPCFAPMTCPSQHLHWTWHGDEGGLRQACLLVLPLLSLPLLSLPQPVSASSSMVSCDDARAVRHAIAVVTCLSP